LEDIFLLLFAGQAVRSLAPRKRLIAPVLRDLNTIIMLRDSAKLPRRIKWKSGGNQIAGSKGLDGAGRDSILLCAVLKYPPKQFGSKSIDK
jgi:hypothetical protein